MAWTPYDTTRAESRRVYRLETWSVPSHKHPLIPPAFRDLVFVLMCVRHRLSRMHELPVLPMEVWLLVFEIIYSSED